MDYAECLFYPVPKHGSSHEMSPRMQALYAMKLPCSGFRRKKHLYFAILNPFSAMQ
jgi:hypothetical protein